MIYAYNGIIIYLANNKLKSLPKEIGNIKNLQDLFAFNTVFIKIEKAINIRLLTP